MLCTGTPTVVSSKYLVACLGLESILSPCRLVALQPHVFLFLGEWRGVFFYSIPPLEIAYCSVNGMLEMEVFFVFK
jgi:hypothetical protein